MKVFIINLQKAQDRRENMRQEIKRFEGKLDFVFFDAIEYRGGGTEFI